MERHFKFVIDSKFLQDLERTGIAKVDGENIFDIGYNTAPHASYELPKGFPLCCPFHENLLNELKQWMTQFPNCCEDHKKLNAKFWFSKELYNEIPGKVLQRLSYSENFIRLNIDQENWYNEITDYLSYTIESFGTPNVGGNEYWNTIEQLISAEDFIGPNFYLWKRKLLLEYIKGYGSHPDKSKNDLDQLNSVFQKWIKTIPNISHLSRIKSSLQNKLPLNLLLHAPHYNRFTELTGYKLRTKGELIEILINLTKELLLSINTDKLLESNLISELQKHEIDLLNETHSLNQKHILTEYSNKELKYLVIIKKWLKNERGFFKRLRLLLNQRTTMADLFTIEKRNIFDKDYLKVYIRDSSNLSKVADFLSALPCVKKANITDNNTTDLTVYPAKTYSIDETTTEITKALRAYFEKGIYDPTFKADAIGLSNGAYENILDHIFSFGQKLENFKHLYELFGEEEFRDYFLPHLNSISNSHTATGETFNKLGKTDILIQNNKGENVFIAECKLWKGEGELEKAVDQLLDRYVTWRDEKVALIVFNKDMKNFSDLLKKAVGKLQSLAEYLGQRGKNTSFMFKFKYPDDPNRYIFLELIIFNCC